jgi:predicted metalloprotease with PDZ domain
MGFFSTGRAAALWLGALLVLCPPAGAALAPGAGAAAVAPAASKAPAASNAPVAYTVSMPRPYTHLLEVEMRVRAAPGRDGYTDLVLPVWTPGAYTVRDFARNVQEFAATDAAGRPLPWSKVDKNTWRVRTGTGTGGAGGWRATYRVYANERTHEVAGQAALTDRFAFWNNAAVLMYVAGHLKAPATLRVIAADGWKVTTGLRAVPGSPDTYQASDVDALYDAPVLAGVVKTLTFTVQGIPHRIVLQGDGNYDAERVRRDVQKIVETTAALMGGLPYREYTFLLMMIGGNTGQGLEHAGSTAIAYPRWLFRPEANYRIFLGLAAHEFFHTWNVKRLRPDTLGPFDYTRENHTRLLWVAEGLTRYYENLLLRRAGLISDADYLQTLGRAVDDLRFVPGRRLMSLEEASFDAWTRKSPEEAENAAVDYYAKGGIIGALLDLEIRARSGGAKSLDDVLRALYAEYGGDGKKGRNYTSADFQRACERAAGGSLEAWFARHVRGRDEPDYDASLAAAGLRLDTNGGEEKPAEISYLGVTLAEETGRLKIVSVRGGTPAWEQGLNAGDELLAVDGMRVTYAGFYERMDEKRPGDRIRLTIFRGDELRALDITLGGRSAADYRIVPVTAPSAAQKQLYQAWLGAPYPQTEKTAKTEKPEKPEKMEDAK